MKIYLTLLLTLIFVFTAYGQESVKTVSSGKTGEPAPLSNLVGLTGQPAPIFSGVSMDGTEYDLEKLKGKIVVLNLWGTFCAPCIQEMPKLNELVKRYKDKDVVFLSATADNKQVLEIFLPKHPFDYQVLPASFGIIRQYAPKKKASSQSDQPSGFMMVLPTHLVIDRDGIVTEHFWGYGENTTSRLSGIIDKLLKRKP